jgi:RNA recognition motif-containing protein
MSSESVSIPKNPRTDRPVGYAFVDLSTPTEAERAIAELSGKEILERKVSVQLARKPEPAAEKVEGTNGEGSGEGARRRQSTRGRGRAGRGRAGRARGGRSGTDVSFSTEFPVYKHPTDPPGKQDEKKEDEPTAAEVVEGTAGDPAAASTEVRSLMHTTNEQLC